MIYEFDSIQEIIMRHNITPDDITTLAPLAEQFHRLVYILANQSLGHHPETNNQPVFANEGGVMVGNHEIRINQTEALDYTAANGANPHTAPITIELIAAIKAIDKAKTIAYYYPGLLENLPKMKGNELNALFTPLGAS